MSLEDIKEVYKTHLENNANELLKEGNWRLLEKVSFTLDDKGEAIYLI